MADSRIRIAKDKANLVKALKASDDTTGPFQTYADVVVFAATLGAKRKQRAPLGEIAKDIDPIRQDILAAKGYEQAINLLAISRTKDPKILAFDENTEKERISIFEEHANAGLEILQNELRGSVDYLEQVLLLLSSEREETGFESSEFNLSHFLPI